MNSNKKHAIEILIENDDYNPLSNIDQISKNHFHQSNLLKGPIFDPNDLILDFST